jgi:hypothetical protein
MPKSNWVWEVFKTKNDNMLSADNVLSKDDMISDNVILWADNMLSAYNM